MNRIMVAARLHLIGWQPVTIPYAVMLSALLVNLLIFGLLRGSGVGEDEAGFTGGLLSLYITVALVFVTAVNGQLTFALGFSLTRRTYLAGTAVFATGLALASGVLLYLCRLVEVATDGWFLQLDFFQIGGWSTGDPFTQVIGYAAPMLALSATGALLGAVHARWGSVGVWSALILSALAAGLFVAAVTVAKAWGSVGQWFVDQPMAALLAGYPLIITVVFGAAVYLVLRRVNA